MAEDSGNLDAYSEKIIFNKKGDPFESPFY
jgi:hypothetical protein